MKRVAAIYDIHGNYPALEAVLDKIRDEDVDLVIVGGDVFPGPSPVETLECLLNASVPMQFIRGNGDREVLARLHGAETTGLPLSAEQAVRWVAEQLPTSHRDLLAGWPESVHLFIEELGNVLFCHATPKSDTEIFTRLTPEERLAPIFSEVNASVVVCGHTHMQFDRMVAGTRVVNAGSVGMPFGKPGAYWLLLGPDIQLRQTSYDLQNAAELIRSTAYPQAEEFATKNVLDPASEEQMLAIFSRAELQ